MKNQLERVKLTISSFPDESILFALLIGSMATGDAGPLSDIDVAIYIDDNGERKETLNLILTLGAHIEKELKTENVDIVVLNEANPALKFNAIKTGILLLVRNEGDYEDFVIRTLSEYYDNQYFLQKQYVDAKTAISEGDTP